MGTFVDSASHFMISKSKRFMNYCDEVSKGGVVVGARDVPFGGEMCKQYGEYIPLNKYVDKLLDSHPAKALLGINGVAPDKTRTTFFHIRIEHLAAVYKSL